MSLRLLVAATVVSGVGNGLWLAGGVLFLIRSAGLTATQVGVGLTLAGAVGVVAGIPIGALADALGPRRVVIATLSLEAVATAGYVLVDSLVLLVVFATAAAVGLAGSNSARGALLAGLFDVSGATRARALLRSAANAGIAVGTAGAGVVLTLDARPVYVGMIWADVATFLIAAALMAPLPETGRVATPSTAHRWAAVRDRRYLTLTALNGVLTMHYAVLVVAVPLWVVTATTAPAWVVAWLFIINTFVCVGLQVRAARGLDDPLRAARALRSAGLVLGLAAALFAGSAHLGPVAAVVVLSVAVLVHSAGELLQAGGAFGLSFALAAPTAHGQYQGVWGVGAGVGESAAPALLTLVVIGGGRPGWIAIGLVFAVTGALAPRLARLPAPT